MTEAELSKAVEIVRDRLYYVALRAVPRDRATAHFFSIDDDLVYWNFFLDFGPLNMGQLYRFCQILSSKLHDKVGGWPSSISSVQCAYVCMGGAGGWTGFSRCTLPSFRVQPCQRLWLLPCEQRVLQL